MADHSQIKNWIKSVAPGSPYNEPEPEPMECDPTPASFIAARKLFSETFLEPDGLAQLEIPVDIKDWKGEEVLNHDGFLGVKDLYKTIRRVYNRRQGIIPQEIKSRFTTLWEEETALSPPTSWVRKAADDISPGEAVYRARTEFDTLRKIQKKAVESRFHNRHESHWLSFVYSSLLEHVLDEQVEVENVSTATIDTHYTPILEEGVDDPSAVLQELLIAPNESVTESSDAPPEIVDLVLALKISKFSGLQKGVKTVLRDIPLTSGVPSHMNQTSYESLRENIIAVSIKVQNGITDAHLQLATWTASWYRQMKSLRKYVFARLFISSNEEERLALIKAEENKRLITVPVIIITGHHWEMYFVFFDAKSITMHGPIHLGSTGSLEDTYALVASLRAIQEWILTTFREAMEDWFGVPAEKGLYDRKSLNIQNSV